MFNVYRNRLPILLLTSHCRVPTVHRIGGAGWRTRFCRLLLRYGYPALAVTLLVSAIGPPMPAGLSAVLAGVLSAGGGMNLLAAISIAVGACAIGDVTAYGLGRIAGVHFLDRRGSWFGHHSRAPGSRACPVATMGRSGDPGNADPGLVTQLASQSARRR